MDVNEVNGTSEQHVPEAETSKNGTDKLAPEVSAELDLVCSMGMLVWMLQLTKKNFD